MSYDRDDDLRDHFRRKDELTRRHLENQKRSHDLIDAISKRQWDRADYIAGVPPTSQEGQQSPTTDFVPRLHVSIEDIDPTIVNLILQSIISVQVDPSVPPEDKEALTFKYQAAGIAKHIERLERESPRNSAKIRDLQEKEKRLLRGMTAPQELKRLAKEIQEMEKTIKSSRWTAPKRILKKQREKFNDLITERIVVERQLEELRRAGNSVLFPHGDPLAPR